MKYKYKGVITRFLSDHERRVSTNLKNLPLVIESQIASDAIFLKNFLELHSEKILEDIVEYGAVLLRGFSIKSEEDFEITIHSIKGINGISQIFMAELGREYVRKSKFVLYTKKYIKVGGGLLLGSFHNENYSNPDVPAYICFWCSRPSKMGGETGLVDMANIYETIDSNLKIKLESNSFFVNEWQISDVAQRYKASEYKIKSLCKKYGLPTDENNITMFKPSILQHYSTARKSLVTHLYSEINELQGSILKNFLKDYQGIKWFFHRFAWKFPVIVKLYFFIQILISYPRELTKINKYYKKGPLSNKRIASAFTTEDVDKLGKSIRENFSSFIWQTGDILLIDNLRIAHGGMPGFGARTIRAMICNPITMDYSPSGPGLQTAKVSPNHFKSLGEQITKE